MQERTFSQLHNTGYRHLLPIIPPDATISSSSSLGPRVGTKQDPRGKLPGLLRSDGWVGFHDWTNYTHDEADLHEWDSWEGAGIGIRCHDVIAVDIDVTDEALAEMVQVEAYLQLGFGAMRVGQAPKRLLVFRLDQPGALPTKMVMHFIDHTGQRHLIEILGAAQQFVAHGIHAKTGKPYTWDEDLTKDGGIDGLPTVSMAEIEAFLIAVRGGLEVLDCEVGSTRSYDGLHEEKGEEELACADMALVRELVAAIPNGEFNGYDDLAAMAHAVWGACMREPETGLEILREWARKWPHGADDDETARIYDSIKHSGVGIGKLQSMAAEHGYSVAGADFDGEEATEAGELEDDGCCTIWNRYVYVNELKRFMDLKRYRGMDKEQFNDKHGAELQGSKETAASLFIARKVPGTWADRMDYRPGDMQTLGEERGDVVYNTWQPGPAYKEWRGVNASDEDVRPWLDLATHLFGKTPERDTLLDWCASLLQRPGVKPNWHPLVGSHAHGTGKDSFFAPLVRGLGENVSTILNSDIEGQWNDWAANKQLVVVSEITSFERKAVMSRLKSYMSAPPEMVRINSKGVPQYDLPNLFGMVMFTNHQEGVAIEDSDRRFFVLWSEAEPLTADVATRYHEWLQNGGSAKVTQWLFQRDISHFSAQGMAPATAGKAEMRRASLSTLEDLLADAIEAETGPFACDLVTAPQVADWLAQKMKKPPHLTRLGLTLKTMGLEKLGRVRIPGEGRVYVWAVRRTQMYGDLSEAQVRKLLKDQREKATARDLVDDFTL